MIELHTHSDASKCPSVIHL